MGVSVTHIWEGSQPKSTVCVHFNHDRHRCPPVPQTVQYMAQLHMLFVGTHCHLTTRADRLWVWTVLEKAQETVSPSLL